MLVRQTLLPALLSALVVSTAPVLAAQTNTPAAAAEPESNTEHPNKAALKAFGQVKTPIAIAIAAAEKLVPGSKAIDVSFEAGKGKPVYKVKTYQNNSVWEGVVDARSGRVIGSGSTTPESQLDQEDQAELAGLQQAGVTLSQAIEAAEKFGAGKAISAGLEETNGKIVYEIMIVKNGSTQKIVIDPKTGRIAA
jgi:uncharacterized membrane protein YkoI